MFLCWLSKPKAERELYRFVKQHRISAIVELGLEDHDRCRRMIRLAKRFSPSKEVSYCGIDLFDARPDQQPKLTLKQTHQVLSSSGASIRLVPGDALSGLARCANQLQGTELLLISPEQDPQALAQAWMYVPRMLSNSAIVLQATRDAGELTFHRLPLNEVQSRSNGDSPTTSGLARILAVVSDNAGCGAPNSTPHLGCYSSVRTSNCVCFPREAGPTIRRIAERRPNEPRGVSRCLER